MGGFDPVGTPNTVHHPSGLATTPQNAFWTVPAGCTQRSFLRAGLCQSMGAGRTEDDSVDNEEEVDTKHATKSEVINLEVESGNPVIDGRALQVSLSKKDAQVFGAVRSWDKTQRDTLTPEARLAFFEAATSCISPEGNKLSAPKQALCFPCPKLANLDSL